MNAMAQPISFSGPRSTPIVERLLREAMADPKAKAAVLDATGWDASMPSKILSNGAGITLEHLNTVFTALGLGRNDQGIYGLPRAGKRDRQQLPMCARRFRRVRRPVI